MIAPKTLDLTQDQVTTITCALRLAADRYLENAERLRGSDHMQLPEHAALRLAAQFERQRNEAIAMSEAIEEVEGLALIL